MNSHKIKLTGSKQYKLCNKLQTKVVYYQLPPSMHQKTQQSHPNQNNIFAHHTQHQETKEFMTPTKYEQSHDRSFAESQIRSVYSVKDNPETLLQFFKTYKPLSECVNIEKIHTSQRLKLKKYKEAVFYGEFLNGKRHGQGIMVYNNQRVYEGDWESDYKHGQGMEKFPNNCLYEGTYVNGKPEGIGKYTWPNGEYYEGQWLNGLKHGSGMWKGAKGDSYVGQWRVGKADGYGVHVWINGDRYEGQFKDCLKHGEGMEKFANGDIYKGFYAYGKPSGFGQYYWVNGSYFKGIFKNGFREGQGIWKKGSGNTDKYEGEYLNDKKNGYGIFTWASGNVYKGNYQNDSRNGYGEMFWTDGSFYKGQWQNGIQHGPGEIYVPGEGLKKGIFQNNVLMQVLEEYQNYHQVLKARKGDSKQHTLNASQGQKSIKNKSHKPTFRSRATSQKAKSSIDQARVFRLSSYDEKTNCPHPLLKNNKGQFQRVVRFGTGKRHSTFNTIPHNEFNDRKKQKILHSAFYMHKIHQHVQNDSNQQKNHLQSNGYGRRTVYSRSGSGKRSEQSSGPKPALKMFLKSRVK